MRKLFIALLALTVVAAGAYSFLWFSQASQIKKGIEDIVAKANAKQTFLTYDSIETSGFPSAINVAIIKPHFKGRIDLLLKELDAANAGQPGYQPQFANVPEWTEEWLVDGHLTLSINSLSNHYSVRIGGNWQGNSLLKGYTITTHTKPAGDFSCELKMKEPGLSVGNLWSFDTLANEENFLRDFRMVDCVSPAYVMTEPATNETLMSSGASRFYITREQVNGEQLRVFLKSADYEVTPRGDTIVTTYLQALSPDYLFPTRFSIYGKQNAELDFSYSGPAEWPKPLGITPVNVELTKLSLTNQVYTMNGNFRLNNGGEGTNRTSSLTFKTDATFSPQYDALLQDMVRTFIHQMYTDKNDPKMMAVKPYIERYTQEEMLSIIYPALPNFNALGKLVQALDVSMQGNADLTAGDINMPQLEFSTLPYGITGKGTAKLMQGSPVPMANVTLSCRNCLQLIDDVMAYKSRLITVTAYFNPEQANTMVSHPQLGEGIKRFLTALAAPAADNSFNYTIVSDGATGVTINGKPMDQIMMLYAQHVAPYLNKPQPQTLTQ